MAKNALAIICSMNGVDRSQYNNLQATAALEAMRREHRSVTKKAAGAHGWYGAGHQPPLLVPAPGAP